jgi:hypothetical protein
MTRGHPIRETGAALVLVLLVAAVAGCPRSDSRPDASVSPPPGSTKTAIGEASMLPDEKSGDPSGRRARPRSSVPYGPRA